MRPAGVWKGVLGPVSGVPPGANGAFFDDFLAGLPGVNSNLGTGVFRFAVNGGGYGNGLTAGSGALAQAGRIGLIEMGTGTTNNSTGQAFMASDATNMYCGQAGFVMQAAVKIPPALSTLTNEYLIEFGIGLYPFAPSAEGCVIQYNRTNSTNWSAYTADGTNTTQVTTADSADFVVAAGTWYNLMIVMNAAGTSVSFYVAKIGAPYVLLGTSTTHLPLIAAQAIPYFNISRLSTNAVNSIMAVDWWQLNVSGLSR